MRVTETQLAAEGFTVHRNFSGLYFVREPETHGVPLAAYRQFSTREAALDYCRHKLTGEID